MSDKARRRWSRPFCCVNRPIKRRRAFSRRPPGVYFAVSAGIDAIAGVTEGTIDLTSAPSQLDTVVTAEECWRTCQNKGRLIATVRARRTSVPCNVVTSGRCDILESQLPITPLGNHQWA